MQRFRLRGSGLNQGLADEGEEGLVFEGLREESEGASLEGGPADVGVFAAAHEDDLDLGGDFAELGLDVEAVGIRHADIEHREADGMLARMGEEIDGVLKSPGGQPIGSEEPRDGFQEGAVVIEEANGWREVGHLTLADTCRSGRPTL